MKNQLLLIFSLFVFLQAGISQNNFCSHQHVIKEDCKNSLVEEARELIKAEAFELIQPYYQESLAQAIERAKKNPDVYANPPATCFDPSTPIKTVEAFYAKKKAILNSLGIPDRDDDLGLKFTLTNRWSSTATDGGGLGQGDITTLTWSYVPDGTSIASNGCQVPDLGTLSSDFIAFFNGIYGPPTTAGDFTTAPWHGIFVSMFDSWSSVTGLTFAYEPNDDGIATATSGNPGILGTRGDMRIAGHLVDGNGGVLACNYFPNNGDMIIDTGDNFYANNTTGPGTNNLLAHEIGHGIGLRHVCPANDTKLMEPFISTAYMGPQEDDILGANRHYGDADEENDNSAGATSLGANPLPASYSKVQRSIDDNGDTDTYSFFINEPGELTAVLTPTGSTYLEGAQNTDGTCQAGTPFNAMTLADVQLEVLDLDGISLLAGAGAGGAGSPETISNLMLPAVGTYYVRVSQQGALVDEVQMYDLDINISSATNLDCQSFNSGTNLAIPDNSSTGIDIPISVSGSAIPIAELNVSLDIGHTFVGDLRATLTSPIGTIVSLFDRPGEPATGGGCSGDNLDVSFDDSAASSANDFENTCSSLPAISGDFQSIDPLSAFNGEDPNGTWTLNVSDHAGGDIGTLTSASLEICVPTANSAPTSTCADPIEVMADFCAVGIGPGTPSGIWASIPASGIILLQVGPIHMVDLNCLMDDLDPVGDLEIRLASSQFIGTPTSCLMVIESVFDIRDSDGNISLNLVTVHYTLENNDPITHAPPTGISCGETFTMQSQLDYIHTVDPASSGVSSNQDCRSALIWATGAFDTPCGDFTDFSISFSAESSPAPTDLPDDMIFGGTSGNPIPAFTAPFGYIPPSQYFYGSSESCSATTRVTYNLTDECGKTFTCFFLIEVTDNQDPIPACNDIQVSLDPITATYTLTSADEAAIGAGSSDNCGIDPALTGIPPTTFTMADVGDNQVSYTVTDNCGNTESCVATVTVIVGCDLVVDCSNITDHQLACRSDLPPVDFDLPIIVDSCGAITPSALTIIPGNSACPNDTLIVTRTYFIQDALGNMEQCMQTFTIVDDEPPMMVCQDITIQIDNSGMATITPADVDGGSTNNCGSAMTLSLDIMEFTCANVGANIVTLTGTDVCGNTATCTATVTVESMLTVDCSNIFDQTLSCRADLPPVDFDLPIIVDSCGNITLSALTIIPGNSGCPGDEITITRTYFIQDQAGNMEQCMQTFTVVSNVLPTIVCPANEVVECAADIVVNVNNAVATVECGTPALALTGPVINGDPDCPSTTYTYTYTVTDACGRTESCDQIFTIENDPPTIECPADMTVECFADISVDPMDATVVTSCTLGFNTVISGPVQLGQSDCPGTTYTYTYTTTDDCGRVASCDQIFTIQNAGPILTCPAPVTVECADDIVVDPSDVGVVISCGLTFTTQVFGPNVYDGDPDCPGARYVYRYLVEDECGRISICEREFIIDNAAPTVTCIPNQIVECEDDIIIDPEQVITVVTSCDLDADIDIDGPNLVGGVPTCNGAQYSVTYTVTDPCGRTDQCTVTWTLANSGPMIVDCAPDRIVECQFDIASEPELLKVELACGTYEIFPSNIFPINVGNTGNCPGDQYGITYQVFDVCGRSASCTQVWTIENEAPRVIPPDPITVACLGDVNPDIFDAEAETSCGLPIVKREIFGPFYDESSPLCAGSIVNYLYSFWDACGRMTCEAQIVTINPGATMNGLFEDIRVECGDVPPAETSFEACGIIYDLEVSERRIDHPSPRIDNYRIIRTYTSVDACGNQFEIVQTIFVICRSSQSTRFTDGFTDIDPSGSISRLEVFPNPAIVNINYVVKVAKEEATVRIYSGLGNLVYEKTWLDTGRENISLDGLPSGVYQMVLFENDRVVETKKFIKQSY